MNELYDHFKGTGYTYMCSEKEMRAAFELHIKTRYADWTSTLRNLVFHKYKTTGERYINCPSNVSKDVWCKMVEKWEKPEWKLDHSGIEPSPIDCFKKFYVSKRKSEGEETWASEKAKELYEKMDNKKNTAMEEQNEVNDWVIYKEVIGGPSHDRLLGVGAGFSTEDAYSSNSQSCNKRMCLEREESHEQLKDQVNTLTNKLNSLEELVERLMPNNSNNYAHLGPSASMTWDLFKMRFKNNFLSPEFQTIKRTDLHLPDMPLVYASDAFFKLTADDKNILYILSLYCAQHTEQGALYR
ncbi:hypothetical protein C1H46_002810 [Malus baccata]|uniref:Uncharacterized protein n=1 Tax=Malus baccata TaxID=106549 RepID=A0A540NKP5_MALBA|nr:hypothetical protein C1H46_002810 [Malus baccata]